MRAIYLCGFMGCGKSTVGRAVAKLTGRELTDLDQYIEEREGLSIPEIFERYGEEHFRDLETRALRDLGEQGGVIATGGGALLRDENAAICRQNGKIFFIDTPFELCYARIKDDPHRPIAASSTESQLRDRFDQRRPIYKANSDSVVSGELGVRDIARIIAGGA